MKNLIYTPILNIRIVGLLLSIAAGTNSTLKLGSKKVVVCWYWKNMQIKTNHSHL